MDYLPVCKKCCFCVPLRYGLLTWGYLKLLTALMGLAFFILLMILLSVFMPSGMHNVLSITISTIVGFILTAEIVFHILFIIGAHKKNVKLLRVYYYYAMVMWVFTIVIFIVSTVFIIKAYDNNKQAQIILSTLDFISFIISILVQTFMILSLRSEIIKLRSNCPYRFVKNDKDPEGTIISVKDDIFVVNKMTERIL